MQTNSYNIDYSQRDPIEFIRKWWEINSDVILKATEARTYYLAMDRLTYIFHYYPEIKKWKRWQIGALLGLSRETVARNMKEAEWQNN